jgi:DNA-binding CsgD family transcriptional regulator
MITNKEAEVIYNKLELYTGIGTDKPWWQLTDREQDYFRWLLEQPHYQNA